MAGLLDNFSEDQISAVHALEGRHLKTGWKVLQRVKSKPGSTGGNFSVCYLVEKEGKIGFLKALNVLSFLRDDNPDLLKATTEMLNTFNFERELLKRCANKNFTKVSRLLEAEQENIPGFLVANVYYMIFEKADSDVRNHLTFSGLIDTTWKLRSLHNIAVGLKQLHSIEISHQDVKPSNIFVFDEIVSKVGDLGRSLCSDLSASHSNLNFSGDHRYAPPEVFHGFVIQDWKEKVFAIDCFLLGSMASYYFTLQNMTALLSQHINRNVNILSLSFDNALPYWIEAFDNALETISYHLDDFEEKEKLIEIIRMLCNPDPRKRGHKKDISQKFGNQYNLERFVEMFNLMARKSEYKITKVNG